MSIRRASRFAVWLGGLGMALLPLLASAASPKFEADLDRLLELFQVRDAIAGMAPSESDPGISSLPASERACVLRVVGAEALFAEARAYYRQAYADPEVLAEALAFHERPIGQKLSSMLGAGSMSINDVRTGLDAQEAAEIDRFLATPAGRILKQIPRQMPRVNSEWALGLGQAARRECGSAKTRTFDGEIERLLAIFHVREKSQRTLTNLTSGPEFAARPAPEQACLRDALTLDPMMAEMRAGFRGVFTDPGVRTAILVYFESDDGRALIDRIWAEEITGVRRDPFEGMSPAAVSELEEFVRSPAGQAFFKDIPSRLEPMRKATVDKLARRALAECEGSQS